MFKALQRALPINRFKISSATKLRRSVSISTSILDAIPKAKDTDSAWAEIRRQLQSDPCRLVVLDDDPTGCQTVYDVNVLLDYSVDAIARQLERDDKLFYVLTNTRSMPARQACEVVEEVLSNIESAALRIGYGEPLQVCSRSDSTLRGHYPAETDAMQRMLRLHATILVPAFFEGGRVTLNDIHYVQEGDVLTPAAETPFARDAHFGFKNSNLRDWVQEKTRGAVRRSEVVSVSLEDIRQGGAQAVADKLEALRYRIEPPVVIVNAIDQHDLNIFMLGLLRAEQEGCRFLYRTAASFVASRAGLEPRRLLEFPKPPGDRSGGLIVVGSYVPKTTAQLQQLLATTNVWGLELSVQAILAARKGPAPEEALRRIVAAAAKEVNHRLYHGRDVVLYTSRAFHEGADLADTAAVSKVLTDVVRRLAVEPSFLVAKGGITSHDVAQHGLAMAAAQVLGQIEPGVPVWQSGDEARFPGLKYVVFPGNVGDEEALARVAKKLGVSARRRPLEVEAASSSFRSASLLETLRDAKANKSAIAAFNVYNIEGARAAVEAAEREGSPVILQVHPAALRFGGPPLLDMLRSFQRHASVPVFVTLDHAEHERDVETALRCGVDGVMVDGSARPFDENLAWTRRMVAWAHERGAVAEAELGRLAGSEDGLSVDERDARMTDPAQAGLFVRETRADMLAVTIGNVHGRYSRPPQLDFSRLEAIQRAVPADMPLVLHGASGLGAEWIGGAVQRGVCKFNVNTDLRGAALAYQKEVFTSGDESKMDVLPLMAGSSAAMSAVAAEKIRLFRHNVRKLTSSK